MTRGILAATILLLIVLTEAIYSQLDLNKTAQSTMNFLLIGTSPRAAALGEAFTAIGFGSESMYYNPAGLTEIVNEFDISINYTSWIADINYLGGAAAWNLETYGIVGVQLMTVDYGVINGTSLLSPGEENIFPLGYKDNGEVGNVGAYVIGLSYAKAISREFSIGGNVKYAGQNLGANNFGSSTKQNNAAKLVFDAGVKYATGYKGFSFGMYFRNFSTNIKREEIIEQLPSLFSFGAAINLMEVFDSELAPDNSVLFAVDILHPNNYSERVNMGMEYNFQKMVAVRIGYQTNRDLASWSAGLGFNTSISDYDIGINYSYSAFEFFNNVQRISLNFSF